MELPEPLDRYRISLRVAERQFKRLGRHSIDGKEPHDVAMQSLFSSAWSPYRVRLDVIDAYRRDRGRSHGKHKHRTWHPIPFDLRTEDARSYPDWMDGWDMTPGQHRIALLISQGLTKAQTARWLGITQTAVGDALRKLMRRNPGKKGQHLDKGGTLGT